MSAKPRPSAVVFVDNVTRLAAFYQQVADMAVLHAEADHVVLESEGFQVVIHGIPRQIAATLGLTEPPAVREDSCIKLCLPVSSIEVARAFAGQMGGRIAPKAKEWEARGFRACDGHDPEGNVFQVRESAP